MIKAMLCGLKAQIYEVPDLVNFPGDLLTAKIDGFKEEITSSIDEIHSDLRDDLRERRI